MKLSEKIAVSGLVTVLAKVLVGGAAIHWGDSFSFSFGSIDGVTCAAILTPCLSCVHLESWVAGNKNDNKS
jgi:hypothetical protein